MVTDVPGSSPQIRRLWTHFSLRGCSPDSLIDTLYVMADDHGLSYLSSVLRDNAIPIRILVPRIKSEIDVLSACPRLQLLGGMNKLDTANFSSGDARVAVIVQDLGFGDCLTLLSALKEVEVRIKRRGLKPRVAVFTNFCSPVVDLFRLSKSIVEIHLMPQPVTRFAHYDAVIDLDNVRFTSDHCLVDSMLEAVAIDPCDVPLERKRIVIDRLPRTSVRLRLVVRKAREKYRRLILFSPIATGPTRCMPLSAVSRLQLALSRHKDWLVVTAHPGLVPQGFTDWSYLSHRFRDFIAIVSMCDGVVSVDTSTFYVADAVNKPAVAMFTTRPAYVWSGPYPRVSPIQVGQIGPLGDAHITSDPNLIRYAETQWDNLDFNSVVDLLDRSLSTRNEIRTATDFQVTAPPPGQAKVKHSEIRGGAG